MRKSGKSGTEDPEQKQSCAWDDCDAGYGNTQGFGKVWNILRDPLDYQGESELTRAKDDMLHSFFH